jgi:hypothetical protein
VLSCELAFCSNGRVGDNAGTGVDMHQVTIAGPLHADMHPDTDWRKTRNGWHGAMRLQLRYGDVNEPVCF